MEDLERFERWDAAVEGGQILFPQLEKLSIVKCPKLIDLPEAPLLEEPCSKGHRLAHTPFSLLENLFIRYFEKVIALPEVPLVQEPCSGGHTSIHSAFPALKVIELKGLERFQRWGVAVEGEQILFPQLERLSAQMCPKIIDLPEAPKLSVIEIVSGKQEIFHCVDRYLSSLTKLILKLENTESTSEAECTSVVLVDNKEKWNKKSPLAVMELECCNSFFGASPLERWDYFVHLEKLEIVRCEVLFHWPEKVFQSLVSLRTLVIRKCKNLTGYAQAPLEPSASGRSQHLPGLKSLELNDCESLVEMFNVSASLKLMCLHWCDKLEFIFSNHFCPCLESLSLSGCGSLPAVLSLPPSLKAIFIDRCSSIQVLSCQLDGVQQPQVTSSINAAEPAAAAAAREHSLPPCLQSLEILYCAGMLGGILRLPTSLKNLRIDNNSGLKSLESLLKEHPPSLKYLWFEQCSTLASLPNEPQVYGSLRRLKITGCPAIKKLPRCLQQQLGSIFTTLDARYEVVEPEPFKPFEPKTWKEIPRLARERRLACCN